MSDRVEELLERIALGVERLGEDPVIQMETGPPNCPHCDTVNPIVAVRESEAAGPMAEFIIRATCENCGYEFYAMPLQWECVKTIAQIHELVEAHKELGGYGDDRTQ